MESKGAAGVIVAEFIPVEADRDLWTRFHAFRKTRHQDYYPEDPYVPDDMHEKDLTHPDQLFDNKRWLASLDGEVVGYLVGERPKPTNPEFATKGHIMDVWFGTLAAYRNRGIEADLLTHAFELTKAWDSRLMTLWTSDPDSKLFAEGLGLEVKMKEEINRLDLSKLDWGLVDRWIKEGESRSPGTRLQFFETRLPESLLDEYLPIYSEINNDMPMEDIESGDDIFTKERFDDIYKWMDSIGGSHHTYISREADGQISGLTDVLHKSFEPLHIHQWATGVVRRYRGRGLGKLLKAAMLDYVRRTYPVVRFIITENAFSNGPMLAINHALGFETYRTTAGFQAAVSDLEQKVADR